MNFIYGASRVKLKLLVLLLVSAIPAVAVMFLVPPLAQDPRYHAFADQRAVFGVPHFWNSATSVPFIVVGIAGLRSCLLRMSDPRLAALNVVHAAFFAGISLVGVGSMYYHLNPSTESLLWDRLPMSMAFMAFVAAVIGERVSSRWGRRLLIPLVAAGLASVIYWAMSEARGVGDLRLYVLIQFLPMVLIPLILMMFGSGFTGSGYIWAILATYAVAKLAEQSDAALFEYTGVLSGHSIKHLLSALAAFWMLLALIRRPRAGAR